MVSTLKGPIAAHPMFDVKGRSDLSCPVPRVRPEAQEIAAMHQGSVGLVLQIDGRGYGGPSSANRASESAANIVYSLQTGVYFTMFYLSYSTSVSPVFIFYYVLSYTTSVPQSFKKLSILTINS